MEHRRFVRPAVPLVALAMLLGCGSDSHVVDHPTPTLRSLAINPSSAAIKVGEEVTYTVTATMSDNSTSTVTASWSSDNAAVLTIEASGRAHGLQAGLATIIATYQGMTKSQLIQVVLDYEGTWVGDYTVTRCEASGDFDGICGGGSDAIAVGDRLAMQAAMTQTGTQVTGTLTLGELTGPITASVEAGGALSGTASLVFTAEGVTFTTSVSPLHFRAEGERLTGDFVAVTTAAVAQGNWTLGGSLHSVARTSAAAMPFGVERPAFGSLQEAVRAFRRH